MDEQQIQRYVLQFLHEKGFRATQALFEDELGFKLEDKPLEHGGLLETALHQHEEWRLGKQMEALNVSDLDESLLHEANGEFCNTLEQTLPNMHTKNVLCCRFQPDGDLLATGSGDKSVAIADVSAPPNSEPKRLVLHSAGVLDLDWNPKRQSVLLSCSMDRSAKVVDTALEKATPLSFVEHAKFVSAAKWSPSGSMFATCSYDSTLNIFGIVEGEELKFELKHKINFASDALEALHFIDDATIVVSRREDNRLYFVDTSSFKVSPINMNANQDGHVSFTALELAVSRSRRYVTAFTDKSRAIMFDLRTSQQVRNFYGADNDGYAMPSGCFSHDDGYLYGTSQTGPGIVCWDVALQKMVDRIVPFPNGHSKIIRCVDHHHAKPLLASGSFDHLVKLWKAGEGQLKQAEAMQGGEGGEGEGGEGGEGN